MLHNFNKCQHTEIISGNEIPLGWALSGRYDRAVFAFRRNETGLIEKILHITDGIGIDRVIITAQTNSVAPVNLAGNVIREKGRVAIVGYVPTGFDREPDYYQKELELVMSCSYGSGAGSLDNGYQYLMDI